MITFENEKFIKLTQLICYIHSFDSILIYILILFSDPTVIQSWPKLISMTTQLQQHKIKKMRSMHLTNKIENDMRNIADGSS